MLKPQQTQRIYALAARLGLVENGNKNDMLHELVYGITKKTSVRDLSAQEYRDVVKELADRLKLQNLEAPPCKPYKSQKYEQSGRGKMSDGQKRKAWQLMYKLEELDIEPSSAKLGDRLCGIIKKELKIDCTSRQPFRWLTFQQGSTLIEKLKKYVDNAQRRKDGENKS